jgi:YfiR/HmsC-like
MMNNRQRNVARCLLPLCCTFLLSFDIVLSNDSKALIDRRYQLIGVYLLHFAEFTRWPDAAFDANDKRLVLCISGANPFGGTLFGFNGAKVGDRTLFIIYDVSVENVTQCHVLFIDRRQSAELGCPRIAIVARARLIEADFSII